MAILIPKHTKISVLRKPSYFIAQVFDLLGEEDKIRNKNSENSQNKIFFTETQSGRLGTELMLMLDNNVLESANLSSSHFATGSVSFLINKSETIKEILERIDKNDHTAFYSQGFTNKIKEEDIKRELLKDFQQDSLADVSTFMLISKGFYIEWL